MIFAGVDVGSMSAEAVLMEDDRILAHCTIVVKPNPVVSATLVMDSVLEKSNLARGDIEAARRIIAYLLEPPARRLGITAVHKDMRDES